MIDAQTSRAPRVGDLLDGRYRLDAPLGEGGMATVYRAFDETLGRTVAVKVFRPGTTDAGDERRRESEKRLLASVSHPSLVTLFDARLADPAQAYLVMEHIDGGTLTDRLERGPISPADAASLAADLGEALHVVHAAGIIHRDIKPANILLRPPLTLDHTFRAVLADFGIAYLVDTARVTTPGMAVGTAAYISPEQVRGAEPTQASDIYSLGLVLIEALTGRRAFPQQNSGEAIVARLATPPTIPATVGYAWRAMLTRMTAIDPRERPSAIEVSRIGHHLDVDPAELATGEMPVMSPLARDIDGVVATTEPTRLLPAATDAGVMGNSPAAALAAPMSPAAAGPEPTSAPAAGSDGRPRTRRRVVTAVSTVAAAGIIALAAVVGSGPGDALEPASTVTPEATQEATQAPEPSVTPDPVADEAESAQTTAVDQPVSTVSTVGGQSQTPTVDQPVTPKTAPATNAGPGKNSGNGNAKPGAGKGNENGNGNGKGNGKGK